MSGRYSDYLMLDEDRGERVAEAIITALGGIRLYVLMFLINTVVSGILLSFERELAPLILMVSYIVILVVVYYGLLMPCTDLREFFDEFSISYMLLVALTISLCVFPIGVFLSFIGGIGGLLMVLALLGNVIGMFGIGIHIWKVGEITKTSEISTAGILSIIGWFIILFIPGSGGLTIATILGILSLVLVFLSYRKAIDNTYSLYLPKQDLESRRFDELLDELTSGR